MSNARDMLDAVEGAIGGKNVGVIFEGCERYLILVRRDGGERVMLIIFVMGYMVYHSATATASQRNDRRDHQGEPVARQAEAPAWRGRGEAACDANYRWDGEQLDSHPYCDAGDILPAAGARAGKNADGPFDNQVDLKSVARLVRLEPEAEILEIRVRRSEVEAWAQDDC